jgi:hypothetical protein
MTRLPPKSSGPGCIRRASGLALPIDSAFCRFSLGALQGESIRQDAIPASELVPCRNAPGDPLLGKMACLAERIGFRSRSDYLTVWRSCASEPAKPNSCVNTISVDADRLYRDWKKSFLRRCRMLVPLIAAEGAHVGASYASKRAVHLPNGL